MVNKLNQTASERRRYSIGEGYTRRITGSLLAYKITGLTKGLLVPDDLIAELERYIERNSLGNILHGEEHQKSLRICCPKCLKAHMMKTADKMGLGKGEKQFLALFIKGETGHEGYYLDEDELVSV